MIDSEGPVVDVLNESSDAFSPLDSGHWSLCHPEALRYVVCGLSESLAHLSRSDLFDIEVNIQT